MPYTERFTEVHQLLATIYAANVAAEQNSGYVDIGTFHRAVIIIHPLALTAALNVDIEEATDTLGTSPQAFQAAGHDITVAAADTEPSVIEIRTEECDVNDHYHCINLEITPAGATEYFVAEIWGVIPRFAPVSTAALDSVTD